MINKLKNILYGDDFDGTETWWDCIQSRYWMTIPYDWRPREILYRLKCFLWYRYTTIRPRTLNYHTWCDRGNLLAHMMFEILSEFIENECSSGDIDWYWKDKKEYPVAKKIVPGQPYNQDKIKNPEAVWIIDEMKELLRWWQEDYLVMDHGTLYKEWHDFDKQHMISDSWTFNGEFDSQEKKKESCKILRKCGKKEDELNNELNRRLIRLVNIREHMWT